MRYIFIILVVIVAVSITRAISLQDQGLSSEQRAVRAENAFIQGCVAEGGTKEQCACFLGAMQDYHAHSGEEFLTNPEILRRVNTDGYTESEVRFGLSRCL
jgi:hypothetical protein